MGWQGLARRGEAGHSTARLGTVFNIIEEIK